MRAPLGCLNIPQVGPQASPRQVPAKLIPPVWPCRHLSLQPWLLSHFQRIPNLLVSQFRLIPQKTKKLRNAGKAAWVRIPGVPHASCVTLGESLPHL